MARSLATATVMPRGSKEACATQEATMAPLAPCVAAVTTYSPLASLARALDTLGGIAAFFRAMDSFCVRSCARSVPASSYSWAAPVMVMWARLCMSMCCC